MTKKEIKERYQAEEILEFSYKKDHFVLFKNGEQRFLFQQVEEEFPKEGKEESSHYELPNRITRDELLSVMNSVLIEKLRNIVLEYPKEEAVELKRQPETTLESPQKPTLKLKISKAVVAFLLTIGIPITALHLKDKNIYIGLEQEELLDQIKEDSRSFQEVIQEDTIFLENRYYGTFSNLEQEEFCRRVERFASYLTTEEQEIFKYQLSQLKLQKTSSDSKESVRFYAKDCLLYVSEELKEKDFHLEYAFCEMLTECYLGDDFYVFNNQRFFDSSRVPLGENFSFYNHILFLNQSYPEYQSQFSTVLGREEFLYYQLVLQGMDSNLSYLPFDYQMKDVIQAYQKLLLSEKKVSELFSKIELLSFYQDRESIAFYERRHEILSTISQSMMQKERIETVHYFWSLVRNQETKNPEALESWIQNLASHYQSFSSLLNQINDVSYLNICEDTDFKIPYREEVLPDLYQYGRICGVISDEMSFLEFSTRFFDAVVNLEEMESNPDFLNSTSNQKQIEF